jgi:hypothetical protein
MMITVRQLRSTLSLTITHAALGACATGAPRESGEPPAPTASDSLRDSSLAVAPDSTSILERARRTDSLMRADSTRRADSTALAESEAPRFSSEADSLDWVAARERAERAHGYRIVVSLLDRHLWVVKGQDTLYSAPAAVAMNTTLSFGGRMWTFETPRGRRTVLRKQKNPMWVPPLWHYAEVARDNHLALDSIRIGHPVRLSDGSRLVVRNRMVGIIPPDSSWTPLPTDEEIIFDDTLFVPPLGTLNRLVPGELGRYRLDTGNGYLIHGTPQEETVGKPVTHGCIRLKDEDITWLYEHVPVGTAVYIY